MYSMRFSGKDEEGVMGYQLTKVTPANMQPRAAGGVAINNNLALRLIPCAG